MDIQYIGENLLPGRLGHIFTVGSFIMALLSAFSYWRASANEISAPEDSRTWLRIGKNAFILHAASTISIFFCLYYIITNHLFEYHYAWAHSSRALDMKYLLACFWEGQEGSFLLWATWHAILGMFIVVKGGSLETRVMVIVGIVQAFLASMILGVQLGSDVKIGTTAFNLLREAMEAPIFQQADYLSKIDDGNGLNVLLQNYWMVIHPPVLFLGFATCLFPFAYSVAALWKNDYQTFIRPTWIWSLITGGSLGLGIMMGGAWAYESLTFGGYWAWDPVENASLVPWLIIIAGLHTLIVFKATGRSLPITMILILLSYLFVWYSTFLTRTGILGDTSVHSFTGEGSSLTWHLLICIFTLLIIGFALLIKRWSTLPRIKTEEDLWTREFWMFIGSIVLLLSSLQISISTSIPVWAPLAKWITGKDIAPPIDVISHYNDIQVWVAIIVGLLTATILYLKFKKSDIKTFRKRLLWLSVASLLATIGIAYGQSITHAPYILMLFCGVLGVFANLYYIIKVQNLKFLKTGPATAHLGFALMLIGILLSSYGKDVISINTLGRVYDFGKDMAENIKESRENVTLYRDFPVVMGDYYVTYRGDSSSANDERTFYKIEYVRLDSSESFTLYPNAFVNPKGQEGLMANPDSRHYFTKDVFTYVTSAIDPKKRLDTSKFISHHVHNGDSIFLNDGYLVFKGFLREGAFENPNKKAGDISIAALLELRNDGQVQDTLKPIFTIRDSTLISEPVAHAPLQLEVKLDRIIPEDGSAEISTWQRTVGEDYVVMKAMIFPYINVLWLSIIVMVIGFIISAVNRYKKKEKIAVK